MSEQDSLSLFNHIICLGRKKVETIVYEDIGKKL